jgi:hypothetical protein
LKTADVTLNVDDLFSTLIKLRSYQYKND